MTHATHTARIVGPIVYTQNDGERVSIPLGPCLVEELDGKVVDVVWGPNGEKSTVLPVQDLEAFEASGHLVLLD